MQNKSLRLAEAEAKIILYVSSKLCNINLCLCVKLMEMAFTSTKKCLRRKNSLPE